MGLSIKFLLNSKGNAREMLVVMMKQFSIEMCIWWNEYTQSNIQEKKNLSSPHTIYKP